MTRLHVYPARNLVVTLTQYGIALHKQGVSTCKYDLTLECRNYVKLSHVLFGGERKTKGKARCSQILITAYRLVAHVCRKKIVFQTIMRLLSDMPFIKHEACTKINLHYRMILFPITKMAELPWSCLQYVHKTSRNGRKLHRKCACKLRVYSRSQVWEEIRRRWSL